MGLLIPSLHLDVPDGWELTLELRLIEPAVAAIQAPLAMKESNARPRANLSVIRRAAEPTTPKVMINAYLRTVASELPGMKTLAEGPLTFKDGSEGASATISFEAGPTRAVQRHIYRIDGPTLTHFIGSAQERDAAKLDAVLLPVVLSFRP